MISALSRLQRSSGSRLLIIMALLTVFSCGTNKKALSDRTNTTKAKVNKTTDAQKKESKVDTVQWVETDVTSEPPITDDTEDNASSGEVKSYYRVALFAPLGSSDYLSNRPTDESYIQYYGGMKLASENLTSNGVSIDIDVFDSTNSWKSRSTEGYDVIITPNDKDQVKELIEFGKSNDILVVSPWYSNSKTTELNPNYLQITPNLREHFNKIVEHASINYGPEEVALVGLDKKSNRSWFKYFQEVGRAYYEQKENPFVEHFVLEDSLAQGEWVFGGLINDGVKAFIVPNYSGRDEAHVYSVLRRLNAEKGTNDISVYGMPLIINSDKINFDYYNNLNVKVAISEYLDDDEYEVQRFRRDFFDRYQCLPGEKAFQGHDLITFLAESLSTHGSKFPAQLKEPKEYLQSTYDIRPVNIKDRNLESSDRVDFYENKHLYIIEFKDGKFRKG